MPRVGGPFWDFASVDDGEYLKVSEAVLRIFDRQEDLRANRARARIKFLIDRVGIEEFRTHGRRGAEGRLGQRARLRPRRRCSSPTTSRRTRRPRRSSFGSPNGDSREFDALRRVERAPQRQEGFSTVEVKVTRGDLTPEQFRGLAQIMRDFTGRLRPHQRAAEPRAALGARRERLRRLAAPAGARPRRRRRPPDHRRRQLPRHRQLQARHHQLDGPQHRRPGAPRGDADRRTS